MKFFSNSLIRSISFLLLFLIINSFFSHAIYRSLVSYADKSSYLWYEISLRNDFDRDYDYYFLGDSQLMSGIEPELLAKKLSANDIPSKIFYFPRPSEQPEGIYYYLKTHFTRKQIQGKMFYLNISPITFSKNALYETHRSLFLNFGNWDYRLFVDSELRNLYLTNASLFLRYGFSFLFPSIMLQSDIQSILKIFPTTTLIDLHSKNVEHYLEKNPFHLLGKEREQNQFLQTNVLSKNYYWEWSRFQIDSNCIKEVNRLDSPLAFTFMQPRSKAWENWGKIGKYILANGGDFRFFYIPFSPESNEFFQNDSDQSPFRQGISFLTKNFPPEKLIFMEPSVFQENDYVDAIHPNRCGAQKITNFIAEKIKSETNAIHYK